MTYFVKVVRRYYFLSSLTFKGLCFLTERDTAFLSSGLQIYTFSPFYRKTTGKHRKRQIPQGSPPVNRKVPMSLKQFAEGEFCFSGS